MKEFYFRLEGLKGHSFTHSEALRASFVRGGDKIDYAKGKESYRKKKTQACRRWQESAFAQVRGMQDA